MDAGTLGYGWTHGYEWRLSVSNGSDRVVVRSAGEGIDNLLAVKVGGATCRPLDVRRMGERPLGGGVRF